MNAEPIQLPLTLTDRETARSLGITYRALLEERRGEANINLEVFCGDECLFEDSYNCLSFAGNHDVDAWDSALNKAVQDFRDVMADLRGDAV